MTPERPVSPSTVPGGAGSAAPEVKPAVVTSPHSSADSRPHASVAPPPSTVDSPVARVIVDSSQVGSVAFRERHLDNPAISRSIASGQSTDRIDNAERGATLRTTSRDSETAATSEATNVRQAAVEGRRSSRPGSARLDRPGGPKQRGKSPASSVGTSPDIAPHGERGDRPDQVTRQGRSGTTTAVHDSSDNKDARVFPDGSRRLDGHEAGTRLPGTTKESHQPKTQQEAGSRNKTRRGAEPGTTDSAHDSKPAGQKSPDRTVSRPVNAGFESYYSKYEGDIKRIIARQFSNSLGADAADDICATAWLNAFRNWETFEGSESDRRRWVLTIANNAAINEYRKKMRKPELVSDLASSSSEGVVGRALVSEAQKGRTPEQAVIVDSEGSLLNKILAAVDGDKDRAHVVYQAYVDGDQYKEIAHDRKKPIGTVMSGLSRARRKILEKAGVQDDDKPEVKRAKVKALLDRQR